MMIPSHSKKFESEKLKTEQVLVVLEAEPNLNMSEPSAGWIRSGRPLSAALTAALRWLKSAQLMKMKAAAQPSSSSSVMSLSRASCCFISRQWLMRMRRDSSSRCTLTSTDPLPLRASISRSAPLGIQQPFIGEHPQSFLPHCLFLYSGRKQRRMRRSLHQRQISFLCFIHKVKILVPCEKVTCNLTRVRAREREKMAQGVSENTQQESNLNYKNKEKRDKK